MFSIWKIVASRGRDEMTMPRSSLRIWRTQSMAVLALLAGSTVKTWSNLFLKKRASFARRPASAAATGDDSRPTVETVLKSTVYGMTHSRTRQRMPVYASRSLPLYAAIASPCPVWLLPGHRRQTHYSVRTPCLVAEEAVMPEPPDQMPVAAGRGHLRASHADRDQVIGTLKTAFVQGMLAKDEFGLRVGQALA